jgi:hypothetical protein
VSVLEDEEEDVRRKERNEEDVRNVSGKSRRENEKHILCAVILFFPLKPCRSSDSVENCDRPGQATGDDRVRRMRFDC